MTKLSRVIGAFAGVAGLGLMALLSTGCRTDSGGEQRFAEWTAANAGQEASVATVTNGTQGATTPVLRAKDGRVDPDVLQAGDSIIVTITDLPMIVPPIEDKIKQDGTITLLENQTFKAAGKTRGQLEQEIRARYVPRYYLKMTVNIKHQGQSQFFFVGGEVKVPNRQVYIGRVTLLRAIQSAGDFNDFANKKKVRLTRLNGTSVVVNCVEAQRDPTKDLEVYPGDRIYVPRRLL